jgi:hypothetical protein
MSVPQSLNFEIASYVLRKVWAKIAAGKDYETSRRALLRFQSPDNEVSLRTVLGLKPPSKLNGVTDRFVKAFFAGMTEAQRQAYFREGAPAGFDAFMREMEPNSDFRLQISNGPNGLFIELTARKSKDNNVDLYHLSIFDNPTVLEDTRLHYNVHVTEEVPRERKGTEQRVYYRFNDVFGAVLRHDNAPAVPGLNVAAAEWRPRPAAPAAPAAQAVVRPRVARGPKPGENFATRKAPALGLNPAAAEWRPQGRGRTRKQKKTRRRRLQRKTL